MIAKEEAFSNRTFAIKKVSLNGRQTTLENISRFLE